MSQPRDAQYTPVFVPGTLWQRIQQVTRQALDASVLQPLETSEQLCEDQGLGFLVRVVNHLACKPTGSDGGNPFLPYEDALYVGDASPTHACVLNKYFVVPSHLLIITRHFEHQETVLTDQDFSALWQCLVEFDALAFYNSGRVAGASQLHKHLQLVPRGATAGSPAPRRSLMQLLDTAPCPANRATTLAPLPYLHAYVRWGSREQERIQLQPSLACAHYRCLAHQVGIELPHDTAALVTTPYNLLLTRRWMLLVPRAAECYREISLNALAFAGALLVQDPQQLALLLRSGPLQVLRSVACPKPNGR